MIILNHTQILKIIIYFLVYKAKSKMVNNRYNIIVLFATIHYTIKSICRIFFFS